MGSGLCAWSPPLVPTGPWKAPCRASLSRTEGGGLTQEIQGHHMTTDGRHLEADWLAGKGPCVLVH